MTRKERKELTRLMRLKGPEETPTESHVRHHPVREIEGEEVLGEEWD